MLNPKAFNLPLFLIVTCMAIGGIAHAQVLEVRDGLLADPAAAVLYVMNPAGGIDAVNARDGSLLWHSDDAQRPLAVQQGRLLAQAESAGISNELSLVLLDAASGVAVASGAVELPDTVTVSVTDSLGQQFSLRGDGGSLLIWNAEQRVIQGTFSETAREPVNLSGAVSVDFNSGDVTTVNLAAIQLPSRAPINLQPNERLSNAAGKQFAAADREHVLISQRDSQSVTAYEWSIYTTAGVLLGTLPAHYSRGDFLVFDDATLVYVQEPFSVREGAEVTESSLQLTAVELTTGNILWTRPLRDTRYQGPYPP